MLDMTDNTGNFISKFAPQSCFFTTSGIFTQSAAQAFGPVDENHYRLTANFDLPADSPAYAVCSSIFLIQPQSGDATKVNLILRPFKQPIQGFNIKYFVYRGLSLASFLVGAAFGRMLNIDLKEPGLGKSYHKHKF
jgi:hypothetical protein